MKKEGREIERQLNAGQREIQWMKEAFPTPVKDSQKMNWDYYIESGNASDKKLYRDWISRVPGSLSPSHLIVAAIQCMRNRGYDVSEAEKYIDEGLEAAKKKDGASLQRITAKIYYLLNTAPKDDSSEYWKYHIYKDWEDIKKNSCFPKKILDKEAVYSEEFRDKIYAGWTAQLIGGALGTQVEGYNTDNIQKIYGTITSYLRPPETYNDDITYELAFLDGFRKYGYKITSEQIAEKWLELISEGYSAEETALRNLRMGIRPPESGTHLNYYSDWIGVQMRTMIHGMAAPGNPRLAAELAVRDGVISHSNSGILGGIFNAVLVAMAFQEKDVRKLVKDAAGCLPADSEYYAVLQFALKQCEKYSNWREAWRQCEEKFKEYNWVHAYPNAAAQIIALWYGKGDFDKTAEIVCMEGKDADCTAAPVLNILGVMYGTSVLKAKWTEPLGTDVHTIMRKYRKFSLRDLCEATIKSVQKAQEE